MDSATPAYTSGVIAPIGFDSGECSSMLPDYYLMRAVLSPLCRTTLHRLLSGVRAISPALTLCFNASGIWVRNTQATIAYEMFLSTTDCLPSLYLREDCVALHLLCHDLDAALTDVTASSQGSTPDTVIIELTDMNRPLLILKSTGPGQCETQAEVPLIPRHTSPWITGASFPQECSVPFADPPRRTSLIPKTLARTLKSHRSKTINLTIDSYGSLHLSSETGGNRRKSTMTTGASHVRVYNVQDDWNPTYPSVLLTSALRAFDDSIHCTFFVNNAAPLAVAQNIGILSSMKFYFKETDSNGTFIHLNVMTPPT